MSIKATKDRAGQWTLRLAALAFLPALFLAACGREETPEKRFVRSVKAMKVGNVTRFTGRMWPGRAKAHEEVELAFRVGGPLIARPVNVGDEVKKGEIIARIDPRDFEVEVRNAEGRLERARATLQRAQADFDRLLRIQKEDPGATSQTAIDRARAQRDKSRADIKSLEAAVDAAKDRLSYTYLKAPRDGTIAVTYVENFDNVRPKQPIVRLLDTSRIEMIVNIPENLISRAAFVKKVRVRFDAFPDREIPARIWEIGKEASQTTRTYPVTLIMSQSKDIKILPGMAGQAWAEAFVPGDYGEKGIEVPVSATFSPDETGKTYVWVIDEQAKTVQKREVTVGKLTDGGVMIRDGLQPGEWVATAGAHYLREGQQVRILDEKLKGGAE